VESAAVESGGRGVGTRDEEEEDEGSEEEEDVVAVVVEVVDVEGGGLDIATMELLYEDEEGIVKRSGMEEVALHDEAREARAEAKDSEADAEATANSATRGRPSGGAGSRTPRPPAASAVSFELQCVAMERMAASVVRTHPARSISVRAEHDLTTSSTVGSFSCAFSRSESVVTSASPKRRSLDDRRLLKPRRAGMSSTTHWRAGREAAALVAGEETEEAGGSVVRRILEG
jgi:hypothetical protein